MGTPLIKSDHKNRPRSSETNFTDLTIFLFFAKKLLIERMREKRWFSFKKHCLLNKKRWVLNETHRFSFVIIASRRYSPNCRLRPMMVPMLSSSNTPVVSVSASFVSEPAISAADTSAVTTSVAGCLYSLFVISQPSRYLMTTFLPLRI